MARAITHNTAQHQFEWQEDATLCVLVYTLQADVMTITYTGVPDAVGGRGIAAELTQFALDTARTQGWKVRPVCSYAAAYLRRHPEYQALLV
ncbi:MAG: N-acetyltransferase [Candidimonas sp.]|nr:MAG: N-acetyltransferase [Candidimonas sp.]TAM23497.1 MAG: N-acetyltransferase [Candidimonas sp.]TAM73964.1 MAG: N-acetyltransferase [Candidimonas sp.]